MNFEIKYFVAILSVLLIFGGLYFKYLYDVPDGQDQINAFVSWLLIVLGIIGMMISMLWKKRINPVVTEYDNDNTFIENDHSKDIKKGHESKKK